jgi:hypothetical protein
MQVKAQVQQLIIFGRRIFETRTKDSHLKGRGRRVNKRWMTPCPGSYDPKYKIVEASNFHEITFGIGDRVDISYGFKNNLLNPGPGEYWIPSIADLITKKVVECSDF